MQSKREQLEASNKKETEIKKACKICKKSMANPRLCVCKAGKDEVVNDGDEKATEASPADEAKQASDAKSESPTADETTPENEKDDLTLLRLDERTFDPELISRLLADNILVINNDRESGTLTIKLQYNYSALSEDKKRELQKWLNAIWQELKKFAVENKLLSDGSDITRDTYNNITSLIIRLSTTHYNAFIFQLARKHLLPRQVLEQKKDEKVKYDKTEQDYFSPHACPTKPSPANKRKREEEAQVGNSPYKRPKLQPKGYE